VPWSEGSALILTTPRLGAERKEKGKEKGGGSRRSLGLEGPTG